MLVAALLMRISANGTSLTLSKSAATELWASSFELVLGYVSLSVELPPKSHKLGCLQLSSCLLLTWDPVLHLKHCLLLNNGCPKLQMDVTLTPNCPAAASSKWRRTKGVHTPSSSITSAGGLQLPLSIVHIPKCLHSLCMCVHGMCTVCIH